MPKANSCKLYLPRITARADLSFSTTADVARRHVVAQDPRAHRARHAGHVEQVLDAERHAVQRTAPGAAPNLQLGFARRRACLVGRDPDVRVQPRIQARDALEVGVGELDPETRAIAQERATSPISRLHRSVVRGHGVGPGTERSGGSVRLKSSAGNAATLRARLAYQAASASASGQRRRRRSGTALHPWRNVEPRTVSQLPR